MRKKLFEMAVRKMASLPALQVKFSSTRTIFLALFMVLGMSSAWADYEYDYAASVTFKGTTTYYSTFKEAASYANSLPSDADNQALITVLKDCSAAIFEIKTDKYIKISGGSHTLDTGLISVYGKLTIIDGTYTSQNTSYSSVIITEGNESILTVNGGTIDGTKNRERGITINFGAGIINGGVIKGKTCGVYVYSSAQLNGGTFYGSENSIKMGRYPIKIYLGSDRLIYQQGDNGWENGSADYYSSWYVFALDKPVHIGDTTNVAAVTVNNTEYSIYDSFDDALTAANNANDATVTLLSNCSTGSAYIYDDRNITLSGGAYTLTTSDCIHVNGNLTVNDGTYVSTTTGTVSCINVQGGSLTLNGGTFSGHGGSINVFGKTVLSALADGKLYYADKDKLYSGNMLSEYINSKVTVSDASSYAAVVYTGKANVAYETFASAIYNTQQASSSSNPFNIILLKDCTTEGFEAPEENGFSIYANKHTLTLTDKVQVKGDLIIADGTFKVEDWNPADPDNTDELFAVTGTLTINGGEIDVNYCVPNAIETGTSGDVKINGGTVKGATQYALYIGRTSTGTVLSGGSLSANYAAIRVPSPMPVCYLLRYNATFQDYYDDFFASETNPSVDIVPGDILYKRDVNYGAYGSICLPFYSKEQSGIQAVYEVASISADNVELKEIENWGSGYMMEAGTPYIFKSDASSICINLNSERKTAPLANDYLVGNFDAMTETTYVPVGNYVLLDKSFKKVTSATKSDHVYSDSFCCYLNGSKVPSSSGAKADVLNINGESEATAIDALNAVMNNSAVIYDVNGRRVQSLQKGINIVNGKKISVE